MADGCRNHHSENRLRRGRRRRGWVEAATDVAAQFGRLFGQFRGLAEYPDDRVELRGGVVVQRPERRGRLFRFRPQLSLQRLLLIVLRNGVALLRPSSVTNGPTVNPATASAV